MRSIVNHERLSVELPGAAYRYPHSDPRKICLSFHSELGAVNQHLDDAQADHNALRSPSGSFFA